ncbi:MAG: alpha/beta fold hydrolase [Lachnospiraceae bacterium]|nr:alpha/beta fold hydrolase [Lachnospiraceae bacterium]
MAHENKEFYINCYGNDIHAKLDFPEGDTGKLPILVLIPGFTGHIEETHIKGVARAANEAGFAVLRAELYGHGKSGGDFFEHNVMLWMTEAAYIVRYAKELPFVSALYLAGHSQGGLTAVLAAGIMNDIVKALIPLSPAMNIPHDAKRGCIHGNGFDNEMLPEYIEGPDWRLSSDYIRAARLLPVDEAVKAYKGPVLIIHGTEDEAVPYSFGKELAGYYENAELVSIEGDTHCYDHHLDQVEKAVKEFLKEM